MKRSKEILSKLIAGFTFQEIGEMQGVSRQRVFQKLMEEDKEFLKQVKEDRKLLDKKMREKEVKEKWRNKPVNRFWSMVEKKGDNECWKWLGCKHPSGHGYVQWGRKRMLISRVIWQIVYGDIPLGMNVCYTCHNPNCCNPGHLQLVSVSDRMRNFRKGRRKLTMEQAEEIRELYGEGFTMTKVAKMYGVSVLTVSLIVRNKIYNPT